MEKRIGVVAILLTSRRDTDKLNHILSEYSDLIIGRLGLPLRSKKISIISVIVEGTTNRISALTGKIGKLQDIQVKSVLTKYKEEEIN